MFRGLVKTVHFIGIGGIGMSAIAEVLLHHGFKITGSDLTENNVVRHLTSLGATIYIGHSKDNIGSADVVVVTSAVKADNEELLEAQRRHIPVVHRSEMLADLMRYKYGICVAGTHGKTTITSLVSSVLVSGGLDPTAIVGGVVHGLGTNGRYGQGEYLVAEADESDGSFLRLFPTIAVISNIEAEHLDHYKGGLPEIIDAFRDFANKVPFYGKVIACTDNKVVAELIPEIKAQVITYGLNGEADWQARNIRLENGLMRYQLFYHGREMGELGLQLVGRHNVLNSLAAVAVGYELGISLDVINDLFSNFKGVGRRLELKGEAKGITVIDDYGHHPTEIQTTIEALKGAYKDRRLVVAFQPHRYSRTRDLLEQFSHCFNAADRLLLTDIYAASEKPLPGVNGQLLADAVKAQGYDGSAYAKDKQDFEQLIFQELQSGDILLTQGAGDIFKIGESILARLKQGE